MDLTGARSSLWLTNVMNTTPFTYNQSNSPASMAVAYLQASFWSEHLSLKTVQEAIPDESSVNRKNTGRGALHFASLYCGDTEIVEYLLSIGASVNSKNFLGHTPLHYAAQSRRACAAEIVRLLVAFGASPNAETVYGVTPLMTAAFHGHVDTINALLEVGAGIEAESGERLESYGDSCALAKLWKHSAAGQVLETKSVSVQGVKDTIEQVRRGSDIRERERRDKALSKLRETPLEDWTAADVQAFLLYECGVEYDVAGIFNMKKATGDTLKTLQTVEALEQFGIEDTDACESVTECLPKYLSKKKIWENILQKLALVPLRKPNTGGKEDLTQIEKKRQVTLDPSVVSERQAERFAIPPRRSVSENALFEGSDEGESTGTNKEAVLSTTSSVVERRRILSAWEEVETCTEKTESTSNTVSSSAAS